MSNEIPEKDTILFTQLILMFQAATMQHLGKIGEQESGEIKRDLTQASMTIDMLDMLLKKCAGNMTPEEEKLLTHVVSELKLNYIDEKGRPDSAESSDDPKETDSPESN